MKAASKLLCAASALAMSAAIAVPGATLFQLAGISSASAATVGRIEVRGNQRVDAETIRGNVGIRPGASFSGAEIDEAVKRLFATGLFSDVRVNQVGSTLVVEVSEYQVVNQVLFQGNKKIKDVALNAAVQLKPRGTYSPAALEADADAIRAAYARIGRDDATVTGRTMDLGENRVNVVFDINEGDRTKIATINFAGNEAFSDRRLSDVISTKRSTVLSFLTRDDIYDEQRLRADEELLRRFYFNRGYADFNIVSAVGELDAASNEYVVSFTIEEGERYTFGDISIESTIAEVDNASLQPLLETRTGDVYSAKDVEDSIIAVTERVASQGYAFAQVTPRGDRNFENRTISVVYSIDQGARTYVERIEIRGNNRTRDFVIRREFDVSEGDAFNQVLIQRAKKRLEALNFFERVEIATAPGSEPDQVILVVDVVEKSTGEFSVGGGYTTGGDTSGPSVEGAITERNFLGRGQFIRFSAGGGKDSRDYTLSFTEPYFLGSRISAGFDIFRNTRRRDRYENENTGATVRFGLPITESLSAQLAYNYSQERYQLRESCDEDGDGVADNGLVDTNNDGVPDEENNCDLSRGIQQGIDSSPWTKSSVSGTLFFNTIDDTKNPHGGLYATFTTEAAGLGGDAEFLKFTGRATYYQTLAEEMDIVGLVTAGAGHVLAYGDSDLRVFDHFQSNDRIIRGFENAGIGPADRVGDDYDQLGGTTYLHASAEAQFPVPVVPESFGIKGALFADAATLYGNDVRDKDNGERIADASVNLEWRASVGAGLIWASPFGPLRVDYAVPLLKEESDRVQNFNFGISTRF